MKSFTRRMLSEKGLLEKTLEFELEGTNQYMPVEVVVEFIEDASIANQTKIEKNLSIIDFRNGNVEDFIIHLAKGIASL